MAEHPISLDKAKELLSGDLGEVYRRILADCCVPIYWFRLDTRDFAITHNGTLTIVQTPKKLLGITAAHVLHQYQTDSKAGPLRLQLMNEVVDDFFDRVIDVSDALDLATFAMEEELVKRLNRTPLSVWPPRPPQEGKGIMIAGYPGVERIESKDFTVNFGLFTVGTVNLLGPGRNLSQPKCNIVFMPHFGHSLPRSIL